MGLNRRQFLKNTSIGTAGLLGGAGLLKQSAFAAYPAPAMSDVSFVGGQGTYGANVGRNTSGGRWQMIQDVLAPFQSLITSGIQGKNIIIKPNCVYTGTADTTGMPLPLTHWLAIDSLVYFLRNKCGTWGANAPILIAEGTADSGYSGGGYTGTVGLMRSGNYQNAATGGSSGYSGVTLFDTNLTSPLNSWGTSSNRATSYLWKTNLSSTQSVNVSSMYVNPGNYIFSICRPKTHNCMVITGTTKNMSMGMPIAGDSPSSKTAMHTVGSTNGTGTGEDESLAYNIFQNATQYTRFGYPNFAILDAWEGMQGNGPVSGTSFMSYCAVCGPDHLAVDRLASVIMGLSDTPMPTPNKSTPSYTDPRYLVWMSNAGLGNYDLTKINFIQGTLANLRTVAQATVNSSGAASWPVTLAPNYTGSPSYESDWQSASTIGPQVNTSGTYLFPPTNVAMTDALYGNPKPVMMPQTDIISGNEVKIELALPVSFPIQLGVYNLQDQLVKLIATETLASGRYSIAWNCTDNNNNLVPNGNYVVKLQFGSRTMADRITVMR